MKLYCSYAFTGEDEEVLNHRMRVIVSELEKCDHEPYCPLFDDSLVQFEKTKDYKSIFESDMKKLAECDGTLALIASNRRSQGQLMEIGATLFQKKPLYLLVHESVDSEHFYLPELATQTLLWNTIDDLKDSVTQIKV